MQFLGVLQTSLYTEEYVYFRPLRLSNRHRGLSILPTEDQRHSHSCETEILMNMHVYSGGEVRQGLKTRIAKSNNLISNPAIGYIYRTGTLKTQLTWAALQLGSCKTRDLISWAERCGYKGRKSHFDLKVLIQSRKSVTDSSLGNWDVGHPS